MVKKITALYTVVDQLMTGINPYLQQTQEVVDRGIAVLFHLHLREAGKGLLETSQLVDKGASRGIWHTHCVRSWAQTFLKMKIERIVTFSSYETH